MCSCGGSRPSTPVKCSTARCPKETVDKAIKLIEGSDFAKTGEGKKVLKKIKELDKAGKIEFQKMKGSRGKWDGKKVLVSDAYGKDPEATASELVHEATHALNEDELPKSKKKLTIDEEMRTNENQLDLYEEQRKRGYRDPELENRRKDRKKGKLRENVRRRYPGTPEHL
jgi:hypothetical protein